MVGCGVGWGRVWLGGHLFVGPGLAAEFESRLAARVAALQPSCCKPGLASRSGRPQLLLAPASPPAPGLPYQGGHLGGPPPLRLLQARQPAATRQAPRVPGSTHCPHSKH